MIVPSKIVTLKDSSQIELRSVRADEADLMLEHLIIAHAESYRNLNRDAEFWKSFSVEEEAKLLQNMASSPRGFMISAYDQGKIIAGLGIFTGAEDARRYNSTLGISIQNRYQGKGLGFQMINYAIQQARVAGLHRIELSVRTYNPDGIHLYEKVGFEKVGLMKEVSIIDGKFVDEFLYQLILKQIKYTYTRNYFAIDAKKSQSF